MVHSSWTMRKDNSLVPSVCDFISSIIIYFSFVKNREIKQEFQANYGIHFDNVTNDDDRVEIGWDGMEETQ